MASRSTAPPGSSRLAGHEWSSSEARQETADAFAVVSEGRAVDGPKVRFLHEADLGLDRCESAASEAVRFLWASAAPMLKVAMAVKIGLRTTENAPEVTRSVRSSGSTPIRHERPRSTCATSVPTRPPRMRATPAERTGPGSLGRDKLPTSAAVTLDAKSTPAILSSREPSLPTLIPASPVVRHCLQVLHPKAVARYATVSGGTAFDGNDPLPPMGYGVLGWPSQRWVEVW